MICLFSKINHVKTTLIICCFFNFTSAQTVTSRLRFEPVYYAGFGFNKFNPNTTPTTSPNFYRYTAFRGTRNYSGEKGMDQFRESNYQYDAGLIMYYELRPTIDVALCVQTSWVGATGGYYLPASGGQIRASRFSISPVKQICYWRKHKVSINAGLGIMLDLVSNTNFHGSGTFVASSIDTISFYNNSKILNRTGISLHPNIQLKMKLENGNSLNVHITGAIGLVPLVSNNFTYSRNQDSYYTELWSNGSFFRIGIGYEFQLLKKRFGYTSKQKVNGTNKYIYK